MEAQKKSSYKFTRRKFFRFLVNWSLRILLLITAGGGIFMAMSFLFPPSKLMQRLTGWVPTVDKNSLNIGESVQILFNGIPYFVLRADEEKFISFSAVCSHAACIVFWEPENLHFACPCHDSAFDINGVPSGGPATEPLTELELKIDETGKIFIKLV